ncbi:HESP042 [Hemileuca sp. nucleopolyhedrovirus]|uniref:HESP042 n=1 Tax=Hemileuca sp. nucleopolyhedrovirus TaxID=1367203 RepID=S5MQA9_9ABAC|nr:HESP042 [Hemileuca sp. nucleopolyhedrovirus]AGR56794.1 HESP042 [Hemileuca sp. nucleopolyhedrovirus]
MSSETTTRRSSGVAVSKERPNKRLKTSTSNGKNKSSKNSVSNSKDDAGGVAHGVGNTGRYADYSSIDYENVTFMETEDSTSSYPMTPMTMTAETPSSSSMLTSTTVYSPSTSDRTSFRQRDVVERFNGGGPRSMLKRPFVVPHPRSPLRNDIFDDIHETYNVSISMDRRSRMADSTVADTNNYTAATAENNEHVEILFLVAPTLIQMSGSITYTNVEIIQRNIDTLTYYMNNLSQTQQSVKNYFLYHKTENSSTTLEYRNLMALITKYPVKRENFFKFSEMFFKYYITNIQNLHSLATIAINVNYTVGRSNVSNMLTYFINVCVDHFALLLFDIIDSNNFVYSTPDLKSKLEFDDHIEKKQKILTNYYNTSLLNLQNYQYYKFTPDNDDNYKVVATSNDILQINLNITKLDKRLVF